MFNTDFEDKFEKLDALLDQFLPPTKKAVPVANYHTPNRIFKSWAVLALDGEKEIFDEGYIRHGHPISQRFCLNTDYCHIEGYRPTGKERPAFIQGFYKKWPEYVTTTDVPTESDWGFVTLDFNSP